jgi:hypothetical protein
MEVAAYDPFLPVAAAARQSLPLKSLEELLAWADIITLHIPRTKETTNLIGEAQMRSMRKGSYLINAARGGPGRRGRRCCACSTKATWPALRSTPSSPSHCRRNRRCARIRS